MTRRTRSITCGSCAAPLDLHGGRRIQSIVCPNCGSQIDPQGDYPVLAEFFSKQKQRITGVPLKLGMEGRLRGVDFTIIGRVDYSQHEDGREYSWAEYCLYSATHGYAWLCWEDHHWVFAREVKDVPSTTKVSSLGRGAVFHARGHRFKVFENAKAQIRYLEGEIPWRAQPGDSHRYADGVDPPRVFTVSESDEELEFSFGEYLWHEEVAKAFGVNALPPARGAFGPQPLRTAPWISALSLAARPFAAVALVALVFASCFHDGEVLLTQSLTAPAGQGWDGIETREFVTTDPGALLRLDLLCAVVNSWIAFDIQVRKDDQRLVEVSREISFYRGRDWKEGSQQGHVYFRLPEAGRYRLAIFAEADPAARSKATQLPLEIELREGVPVTRYLWGLLVVVGISAVLGPSRRLLFHLSKWSEDE